MSDFQTARQANVGTPKFPTLLTVDDDTGDTTLTPYDTNVLVVVPTAAVTRTVKLPAPATCPWMKCLVTVSKPGAEAGSVTVSVQDGSAMKDYTGATKTYSGINTNADFAVFECIAGQFWLVVAELST